MGIKYSMWKRSLFSLSLGIFSVPGNYLFHQFHFINSNCSMKYGFSGLAPGRAVRTSTPLSVTIMVCSNYEKMLWKLILQKSKLYFGVTFFIGTYLSWKFSVCRYSSPIVWPSLIRPNSFRYHGLDCKSVSRFHDTNCFVLSIMGHIWSTME